MAQMRLQSRWQRQGKFLVYYGLRRLPFTNKNRIRLSKKEQRLFLANSFSSELAAKSKKLRRLIKEGVVVDEGQVRTTPKSLKSATFCVSCAANDFIIAGIEFDENGLCPMCAAKEKNNNLVSVLPLKNSFKHAKNSRFDVAVFYTGGKDSSYLLYYLAKVLKLRVLALTWEIPFMSKSAKMSIENAKKHFSNVEFLHRTVAANDLDGLYKKLIKLQNNTCACPSLAYAMFYPTLCQERIPYLVLGNEPVQMKQLYYNNIAPRIAFSFQNFKALHGILNFFRLVVLKKPLRKGQREMLLLVKQLAYGDSLLKRAAGYKNELVSNVCTAMDEIPWLKNTLKKAIRFSDRRALMPSLVHLDLDSVSENGKYDWQRVKQLLTDECGWVQPNSCGKSLHTSCFVEKAKDYSQFVRFYNMESPMIPFSAIEIALASSHGNTSRADAIKEINDSLGFSLDAPKEHEYMLSCKGCPMEEVW